MIKVFVTLVLCSCLKEKLWPTTNNVPVNISPRVLCDHDAKPETSSSIDNTTSITSLQADNITLTSLPFDEIPAAASLPPSNITSTVLFPDVNITLTLTASINNITLLSPEVVDHTPFTTTELANDIPTVTELADNVTSITLSLIETVTSKTTEFINDTSLTITELSNHVTSSTTEFFDHITSVTPSSVDNTSSMSDSFRNFILKTTEIVKNIHSGIESAFDNITSATPSSVDNITSSIAGFNGNDDLQAAEQVNNTVLTTIILPVNNIPITTSSSLDFSSSTEEIVNNVTLPREETFDNITLMTESVHNTTSTTESVNNIISMTPSPFNFSSTAEEVIDDVTSTTVEVFSNTTSPIEPINNNNMTNEIYENITTVKNTDDTTSPENVINTITSVTSSPLEFTSRAEEITDSVPLTTMDSLDNVELTERMSIDNSEKLSLLPIDNVISSRLSYSHSDMLATLSTAFGSEPPPKYSSKDLKVYWNVPTFVCHRHGINFEDISTFGIIQNVNDSWRGQDVAILYDPGLFPAILKSPNGSFTIRNGGVPQKGDLQAHLKAFKKELDLQIDEEFSGVGIIDFEHWRPILRLNWAALDQYRKYSYKIEKEENPDLDEEDIKKLASQTFGENARLFMEETIKMAKTLRPKASWTYYGFPWCNNLTPKHPNIQCHPMFIENNDDIQWLWNQEHILAPSIYIPINLNRDKRIELIKGRLNEARRIARKTNSKPKILPYFWFKYRDRRDLFLSKDDLVRAFKEILVQDVDGFILWGSSSDVNTKEKCEKVHNYINRVFGPLVKDMIIDKHIWGHDVFKK